MTKKILLLSLLFVTTTQYATWDRGNIHIFGDSHSAYSFTNIYSAGTPPTPSLSNWPLTCEKSFFDYNESISAPFFIHWISNTMHEVGRSGLHVLDFRKYDIEDGDVVLLHFGGMDFYHGHIERQYMKGRQLEEIVATLSQNFIETVISNVKMYENLTVVIMAVIPPKVFSHNQHEFVQFVPHIPYEPFIVQANKMLNESLASHCTVNKFLYLNANSFFETSIGTLEPSKSDGQHHVKPSYNYLIKRQLIKLLLEKQQPA